MDFWIYFLAYIISMPGGWLIAGLAVYGMRKSIDYPREFFRWLDVWVGFAERFVATTLVVFAPAYLPSFVGGWVALKFAANWQRREGEEATRASLVALVGSVLSFSVAIAAGLLLNPEALTMWSSPPN